MCIEKYLALHAKSKDGYIKHLEEYLLEHDYYRCEHCKRVECADSMTIDYVGPDRVHVCDSCFPAWDRGEKEVKEIAESDERDYEHAKTGY